MNDTAEIVFMLLALLHMWLVVRFCILHMFREIENRPYHLKWLMLVFFLPVIGYGLYFWLTRNYSAGEN